MGSGKECKENVWIQSALSAGPTSMSSTNLRLKMFQKTKKLQKVPKSKSRICHIPANVHCIYIVLGMCTEGCA